MVVCQEVSKNYSRNNLHAVLALDPAGNVSSPCKRSSEASKNVVPLDPRSRCNSTGFLLEQTGLGAREGADAQENERKGSQKARGHLGHDRSKDLGWWVFALPVGVLCHVQGEGSLSGGHAEGSSGRCGNLGARHEGTSGGKENRKDHETQLGHFGNYLRESK